MSEWISEETGSNYITFGQDIL